MLLSYKIADDSRLVIRFKMHGGNIFEHSLPDYCFGATVAGRC
jgi:hypothetical protein